MDWQPLRQIIDSHSSFLITTHVRPDADALGSEIGMKAILEALGKTVHIINASAPPANLQFLIPDQNVQKLNTDVVRANVPVVDVILVVDTCAWQQLGSMADVICRMSAKRVVIDHHVSSDDLHATEFKDPTAAATGELVFELAQYLGIRMHEEAANALYAAIATDTGWFRFPSTTPRTMRIAADLMEMGASPHNVYNLVNEQNSLARIQLGGRVLSRMTSEQDDRLVWVYADANDLKETGAVPADTEGLVNQCLAIAGSEAAFIAVELQTGAIKFSLRCRPPHNVAAVAEKFGGGGHRLAAGASLPGPMPEAITRVREEFIQMLTPPTT
ncbi:MAG: bifunctional oligoribonuclease/PAP phosphatase NrnA [Planctomycetaceae bacterium]|nr:bifunctional oligoribonuclease/PAP phosphatase NrnA [Planctomycetaceae bacterium]